MLIRLAAVIVLSSFVSYSFWPKEGEMDVLYIYGIVIGVALLVFGLPIFKSFTLPRRPAPPSKPKKSGKVVQLDEFRRKRKKTEKDHKHNSDQAKK